MDKNALVLISAAPTPDGSALRCYVRASLIDAIAWIDFPVYSSEPMGIPRISESSIPAREIRAMLPGLDLPEASRELLLLVKAAEAVAAGIYDAIDMRARVAARRRVGVPA